MDFQHPHHSVIDNEQLDRDEYFRFDAGATAPTTGLADFPGDGPGEVGATDLLEHFMGHPVAQGQCLPSVLVPQQNGPTLSTEPDVSLSLNGAENSQVSLQTTIDRVVDPELNIGFVLDPCSPSFGLIEAASPSPSGSPDPEDQQEVSNHASAECRCIKCLSLGVVSSVWKAHNEWVRAKAQGGSDLPPCRYSGCTATFSYWESQDDDLGSHGPYEIRHVHERSHFEVVDASGFKKYHCNVERCNFSTKRWADLVRHSTTKHCTNPDVQKFPCPDIGCKYGGANGFTRKDKLKSHYDNVHKGNAVLGKAPRALKPKPKPAAGA
ncbi:hypothetical protein G7Y79_00054g089100 [Physcia stellaris]|nr:hypothetical protein G7Y79_00054g089100 [Physcia stellaris]